ncbi:glutamate racemase [Candidatus Liberibacter americanus]|uniref:Glutamate racemase n=1 Tax=Candidatus Liberibacter americanus str. Sao Paulo TaxID=1261131 RepID=U6B8H5_9HYPH|nr:glutamate racemase [Candidatus Liberibacter americanus]AHA28166.1 Glutamate racemase [Candidatus Liberibacter americanus str. Sao Paulo]EMS35922.1 glutamate racemase [Candidatus Liberibacter americanus PW_SP]
MLIKKKNNIIIFDSGVGGLSVLQKVRFLIPEYNFIYVADDVGFPYGNWEDASLKNRIISIFSDILDRYNPTLSIIACNTAFTLAKDELRSIFPHMTFIGAVPAIKQAMNYTSTGLISILSTPATLRRVYNSDVINSSSSSHCDIKFVISSKLASIVEEYACGKMICEEEVKSEINDCFVIKDNRRTDIVVLACTHYPFMICLFRRLAPWPVDWIDTADSIARHARSLCPKIDNYQIGSFNDLAVFISGKPDINMRRLVQGFGLKS